MEASVFGDQLKYTTFYLQGVRLPPKLKPNEVANIQPSSKRARYVQQGRLLPFLCPLQVGFGTLLPTVMFLRVFIVNCIQGAGEMGQWLKAVSSIHMAALSCL